MHYFKSFVKNNQVILLIITILTLIPTLKYWNTFGKPTDIAHYEELYSKSQYVLGEASPHKIDDSEVYIYAGYTYIRGDDPTAVNFEHTPLAKYFFGLSYALTSNSVLFNIPLYFATLLLLYVLSCRVIKNKLIRYSIVILVGSLRLFQFNVSQGMLDIPNLFAALLFFVTLTHPYKNTKLHYILLGIILGVFAGTRYPFPLILLLIGPLFIWAYLKKQIKHVFFSLLFLALTYLATYSVYFKYHSFSEFPKFEWYRFRWFTGARTIPKFLIFQTIFLGKFMGWWNNEWQTVATWTILWPITFVASLIGTIKNKLNPTNGVLLFYTFGLLGFYAIAAASYDRFLIPIIPFWAIIAGIGLDNLKSKSNILSEFTKVSKRIKL